MIDADWHYNFSVALIMFNASVLGRSTIEGVDTDGDCKRLQSHLLFHWGVVKCSDCMLIERVGRRLFGRLLTALNGFQCC